MTIKSKALQRRFSFGGVEIPDPGSSMTPEQVRDLFSATYGDLTNAAIEGPEEKAGVLHYRFVKAVRDKGALDGGTREGGAGHGAAA